MSSLTTEKGCRNTLLFFCLTYSESEEDGSEMSYSFSVKKKFNKNLLCEKFFLCQEVKDVLQLSGIVLHNRWTSLKSHRHGLLKKI